MQDSTLTISCSSVITVVMMLLTFTSRPRWMMAIAAIESALVLFGEIIRVNDASAKYLFSIPGAALMGISIILMIHRTITQWKRERV